MQRGLSAATALLSVGVLVMAGLLMTSARSSASPQEVVHLCSPPDRQFIRTATETLIGLDIRHGRLPGGGEITELDATSAAELVRSTAPLDPTLRQTRSLLGGMLVEYGAAVQAKSGSRAARKHLAKGFRYWATARMLLSGASPALANLGCQVETLF